VVSDLWPITGIVDGDTINVLILANRSGSASLLFMHQLRFAQATDTPCQLDSGLDLEALFFTRISRTVLKDGTVRIEGKLYELDLSLRALRVELRFDPYSMGRIEVCNSPEKTDT
jgi:hypothetical protein